jgi:hypothetical protein
VSRVSGHTYSCFYHNKRNARQITEPSHVPWFQSLTRTGCADSGVCGAFSIISGHCLKIDHVRFLSHTVRFVTVILYDPLCNISSWFSDVETKQIQPDARSYMETAASNPAHGIRFFHEFSFVLSCLTETSRCVSCPVLQRPRDLCLVLSYRDLAICVLSCLTETSRCAKPRPRTPTIFLRIRSVVINSELELAKGPVREEVMEESKRNKTTYSKV